MDEDSIQAKLSDIESRLAALEQRFAISDECLPELIVGVKQDGLRLEFETKSPP